MINECVRIIRIHLVAVGRERRLEHEGKGATVTEGRGGEGRYKAL